MGQSCCTELKSLVPTGAAEDRQESLAPGNKCMDTCYSLDPRASSRPPLPLLGVWNVEAAWQGKVPGPEALGLRPSLLRASLTRGEVGRREPPGA